MTLKDLLESRDVPDDRQFDVPLADGQKLTLSLKDVRDHMRTIHGDVTAREEAIAALTDALSRQPAASAPAPGNVPRETSANSFNYKNDPLFGPIDGRIENMERGYQQVLNYLGQLNTGITSQTAALMDQQYRSTFDATRDRYPGVDYERALRHARDNNIVNPRTGILDPLRAAHDLSADSRLEALKKAEYQRGLADKQRELDEAARAQGVTAIALPGMSRGQADKSFKPKPQVSMADNLKEGLRQAFAGMGR